MVRVPHDVYMPVPCIASLHAHPSHTFMEGKWEKGVSDAPHRCKKVRQHARLCVLHKRQPFALTAKHPPPAYCRCGRFGLPPRSVMHYLHRHEMPQHASAGSGQWPRVQQARTSHDRVQRLRLVHKQAPYPTRHQRAARGRRQRLFRVRIARLPRGRALAVRHLETRFPSKSGWSSPLG